MKEDRKQYLGDSVYASMEGDMIRLTTENGMPGDPSNSIFLERETFIALVKYANREALIDAQYVLMAGEDLK